MANARSDYALGKKPSKVAQGSEIVALFYEFDVPATGDGTALNDTIEMGPLPGGHVPVDFLLAADDLDSNGAPAITLALGILNAAKTDLSTAAVDGGALWLAANTLAQSGGVARPTTKAIFDVQPTELDRNIAVKVTAAAATKQAGKLRLCVLARAVP